MLTESARYSRVGRLLLCAMIVGFFIQISGKTWLASGSARNAQIYIWLLLPTLLYLVLGLTNVKKILTDKYYLVWFFYLAWVAISASWATGADASFFSLAKRGLFVGLYLIAIHTLLNENEVIFRRSLQTALVVIAIGALISLVYQYVVLEKAVAFRAYRIDRMGFGDFANYRFPVAAGIFNGALAVWALGFALQKRSNWKLLLLWMMVFLVFSVYLFMTGTRGAMFALFGGCGLAVLLNGSRVGGRVLILLAMAALVGSYFIWDKIILEVEFKQFSGRGAIWAYHFKVMSGHWLAGHGLGTPFSYLWPNGRALSPHAHSLYLQQVYDSGLISLFLLIGGLAGLFFKVITCRDNPWVRLAAPALVFSLIAMLTDVERIFTRPGDYWTVFWLPVSILLAVPSVSTVLGRIVPPRE